MPEEVKNITLSGTAATEYMGANGLVPLKKGGRRKTQKVIKGGHEGEEASMHPASHSPSALPSPPVITVSAKGPANEVPPLPLPSSFPLSSLSSPSLSAESPPPPPSLHVEGGAKKIRVELKKKGTAKRVQLQPKKLPVQEAKKSTTASDNKSTRRRIRHFTLGVSSLQKRMTRAKKMQKKVSEMPLDKLKATLIQKKLIKATSKAPESVLRQIAADARGSSPHWPRDRAWSCPHP